MTFGEDWGWGSGVEESKQILDRYIDLKRQLYRHSERVHEGPGTWNQLGIDVVQDESLPGARYVRGADRFLLSEVESEVVEPGGAGRKIKFSLATVNDSPPEVPSSTTDPRMPSLAAIDGDLKTAAFTKHTCKPRDFRMS